MVRKLTMYLAGAIRDGRKEDIEWREYIIAKLGKKITILNPLAGKTYNPDTGVWTVSGITTTADLIVKQDFWAVDRADIVLFNFTALSEKYPNIGTLVEFGRATARGCLIYTVIDKEYMGHENATMFKLHPFLEIPSAHVFHDLEECGDFLLRHLDMLSGANPSYQNSEMRLKDDSWLEREGTND